MKPTTTLAFEVTFQGRTKRFESSGTKFKLGRSPLCEIPLPHVHVISREHLMVEIKGEEIWFTDLNSSNGTFYQNEKVPSQVAQRYKGGVFKMGSSAEGVAISIELPSTSGEDATRSYPAPDLSSTMLAHPEFTATHARTQASATHLNPYSQPAPLPFKPSLDQNLLQMQKVEEELANLLRKKQEISEALDKVLARESEFRRMEAEYNTHQASLILAREEKEAILAGMDKRRLDIASLDVEFSATDAQLKAHTALAESKRLELEEKLSALRLRKAEIAEAETNFQLIAARSEEKANEMRLAAAKTEDYEARSREIAAEQANYDEKKCQNEERACAIEAKVAELESERTEVEKAHALQCENERLEALRLDALREEAKSSAIQAQFELSELEKKLHIERETLEAAAKLRKLVLEREAEELITRKIVAGRDLEDSKRQVLEAQKSLENYSSEEQRVLQTTLVEMGRLDALKQTVREHELQKEKREAELTELQEQAKVLERENRKALNEAKESARVTLFTAREEQFKLQADAEKSIDGKRQAYVNEQETVEANREERWAKVLTEQNNLIAQFEIKREASDFEFSEQRRVFAEKFEEEQKIAQQLLVDLQKAHDEKRTLHDAAHDKILAKQADQNRLFTEQFDEASKRAHQDHNATVAALIEAAVVLRSQQAEELRLWSAHEDARIKTIAAENAQAFAHMVSMRALTEFKNDSMVSVSTLMNTLETKIVEALNGQVQTEGLYNPDFKNGVRKFWIQAGAATAALIALGFGYQYGPQVAGKYLNTLKVANHEEDLRFMQEVKLQRERMLALNLQAKDVFQDLYVDNILYNPGYLAMKMDLELQKKWTVQLSKFFFEELLFDDRKVVEYMPIESSLIAGLNETYKILNSRNFAVNLIQMQKLEQEKSEAMWLLVGGKENWLKLRKKEAEFYAQRAGLVMQSDRRPGGK